MRLLNFALPAAAVAALSLAGASVNAAEKHYDCTKAGNANKAQCKAAAPAATPAPTTAAAKPTAAAAVPNPTPVKAVKANKTASGTRSPAQLANDNKMKACGAKWQGLSAGDKQKWDAKGSARKDKNGKPETGWIAYSVDCRKSA